LRDGSWCAYALQRAGRTEAAAAWHRWVAHTLRDHEHRFDEAITAVHSGTVNSSAMMPARFTLDGHEEDPGAIGALTLLLSGASLSAEG
jgi:hypothetical protein